MIASQQLTNMFAPKARLGLLHNHHPEMSQKTVGILGGRESETYKALDCS
jgi:hypothetical protein